MVSVKKLIGNYLGFPTEIEACGRSGVGKYIKMPTDKGSNLCGTRTHEIGTVKFTSDDDGNYDMALQYEPNNFGKLLNMHNTINLYLNNNTTPPDSLSPEMIVTMIENAKGEITVNGSVVTSNSIPVEDFANQVYVDITTKQ